MLRVAGERTSVSGSAAAVGERVRVAERSAAGEGAAVVERARRQVAVLYEERGPEFLQYGLALGRDEELARDALQEAFMRYFVALCGGEEIVAARAWIYRVMHNYLVDRMKEARSRSEHHREQKLLRRQEQDIEGDCFRREFRRLIRDALTAREYDCFRLRTEGMRYEEIAAALHLSSGTVGTLVYRAIRKLRNVVSRERGKG